MAERKPALLYGVAVSLVCLNPLCDKRALDYEILCVVDLSALVGKGVGAAWLLLHKG